MTARLHKNLAASLSKCQFGVIYFCMVSYIIRAPSLGHVVGATGGQIPASSPLSLPVNPVQGQYRSSTQSTHALCKHKRVSQLEDQNERSQGGDTISVLVLEHRIHHVASFLNLEAH